MSTANPRGARQFTVQDLQAGEELYSGRIARGQYTLVNSKYGVQVTGPELYGSTLQTSSLAAARTAVDRMTTEARERAAAANAAWEADNARHVGLRDGWHRSAR